MLTGSEYLLFLVCLAIPVRRLRTLAPVAAAFTVAYSVTLIASAFQIAPSGAWFPPAVAALTAIAIVLMTIDNVFVASPRHRWILSFGFGLAFGFALSFSLRQMLQFAGSHLVTSVLSFTVGVGDRANGGARSAGACADDAVPDRDQRAGWCDCGVRPGLSYRLALDDQSRDLPDDDQLAALRSPRADAMGHGDGVYRLRSR